MPWAAAATHAGPGSAAATVLHRQRGVGQEIPHIRGRGNTEGVWTEQGQSPGSRTEPSGTWDAPEDTLMSVPLPPAPSPLAVVRTTIAVSGQGGGYDVPHWAHT